MLIYNTNMFKTNKADFLLALLNNELPGKSILIIDDEIEVQRLMANYLIKTKLDEKKIIFASNGSEALTKLVENEVGFIIVDLVMPEMDGITFISVLKTIENFKHIPIVISSANINNDNLRDAVIYGIKDIIVKPFNYDLFVDRLCKALTN